MQNLASRGRGAIVRPGDATYEDSRTVWNATIDRRPSVIVRCLGTADVIAGVGNFGSVTRFDFNLYPVGPEIIGGAIAWPIAEASRVLERFRTLAACVQAS